MKKKLFVCWMTLLCSVLLSGCFCEHQWQEATCKAPKTCTECGKTEGEISSHSFLPADCIVPPTCRYCGLTRGSTIDHDWREADCTEPKTCRVCGETEGEPEPHPWLDATTEAPKTCPVCGKTEGEPIQTDPRFTTSGAAALLGKWGCKITANGEMMGLEGFPGEATCVFTIEFGPAGEFAYGIGIENEEAFREAMIAYTLEQTYVEFAAEDMDRETVDRTFADNYGMTTEEYVRQTVGSMNFNDLFTAVSSALNIGGVYYAEAPFLYNALTWENEMDVTMFGFDKDGGLYIYDYCVELGVDARFEKITEEAATEGTEESVAESIPEETTGEISAAGAPAAAESITA